MSQIDLKPLSRQAEIVIQEFNDEVLIYDLTNHKAYSLNASSALVWQLCTGENSVSDIAEQVSLKFHSPVNEEFVWLALEQLKSDNLLENPSQISPDFGGLSRREMIRRIGYACAVSLPIIASLVAPTSAQAQSCTTGASGRALGCPCTNITQCQPPGTRCCLSSVGAANNQTCVVANTQISNGGACGNNCSCTSNCCVGGTCYASKALPAGSACGNSCQCVNTCSAGTCT